MGETYSSGGDIRQEQFADLLQRVTNNVALLEPQRRSYASKAARVELRSLDASLQTYLENGEEQLIPLFYPVDEEYAYPDPVEVFLETVPETHLHKAEAAVAQVRGTVLKELGGHDNLLYAIRNLFVGMNPTMRFLRPVPTDPTENRYGFGGGVFLVQVHESIAGLSLIYYFPASPARDGPDREPTSSRPGLPFLYLAPEARGLAT